MEARLAFSKAVATKGRLTSTEIGFIIEERNGLFDKVECWNISTPGQAGMTLVD